MHLSAGGGLHEFPIGGSAVIKRLADNHAFEIRQFQRAELCSIFRGGDPAEAMILQSGTSLQSAAVGFRLGPVNAPSVAISVKMMRFTPSSVIFTASSSASTLLVSIQPRTATLPSLASIPTTTFSGPNFSMKRFAISGFSQATVRESRGKHRH